MSSDFTRRDFIAAGSILTVSSMAAHAASPPNMGGSASEIRAFSGQFMALLTEKPADVADRLGNLFNAADKVMPVGGGWATRSGQFMMVALRPQTATGLARSPTASVANAAQLARMLEDPRNAPIKADLLRNWQLDRAASIRLLDRIGTSFWRVGFAGTPSKRSQKEVIAILKPGGEWNMLPL